MSQEKIQRDINKKIKEIQLLEDEIANLQEAVKTKRAFVDGMREALKLAGGGMRTGQVFYGGGPAMTVLKPGSDMDKIYDLLKASPHPLHISEIIKSLGREQTPAVRASLVGSLGSYARRKHIFERVGANIWGLISKGETENVRKVDIFS